MQWLVTSVSEERVVFICSVKKCCHGGEVFVFSVMYVMVCSIFYPED
jgi:hypothetical protein